MHSPKVLSVLAALIAGTIAAVGRTADPPPATRSAEVDLERWKPQWKAGDQWVVETSSLLLQERGQGKEIPRSRPIQWQFTVQKYEKVLADDCWRVEVRCLAPGRQPMAVLWVDKNTLALREITSQVPTSNGFATVTENYGFASGQTSPVLGPLSALPVDMPVFRGGQAKGNEKYSYEANFGPPGQKAVGDVGFIYEVQQEAAAPKPEQVKGLVDEQFTKDLTGQSIVELKLKRYDRQVRQLWQQGLPWPVYSDNGRTVARLVKSATPSGAKQ